MELRFVADGRTLSDCAFSGCAGKMAPKKARAAGKNRPQAAKKVKVTPPSSGSALLIECKEAFFKLPKNQQTLASAITTTAKICADAEKLCDDDIYVGAYDFGVPAILPGVLDVFLGLKAAKGTVISKDDLDDMLGPEYLTNYALENGKIIPVTIKFMGMEQMPHHEADMIVPEDCAPDVYMVDFIYNIIHLGLRSVKEIESWVKLIVVKNVRSYMLNLGEVDVLLEKGEHEVFREEDVSPEAEFLREVDAAMKKLADLVLG